MDVAAGALRVSAGPRTDTVVVVKPSDPDSEADVQAARETRVDYTAGRLSVQVPRPSAWSMFVRGPMVDIELELPEGSDLDAHSGWAGVLSDGRLGDVTIDTSGDVRLERTGRLHLKTRHGNVTVGSAAGHAEVRASSGTIALDEVDGTATIATNSGNVMIGAVTGPARVQAASGNVRIRRALGSLDVTTAYGTLQVDEVVEGSIVLETAYGTVDIGVRQGSVAWLDLSSQAGQVHNSLEAADGPEATDRTVQIRARTRYGAITVRRA